MLLTLSCRALDEEAGSMLLTPSCRPPHEEAGSMLLTLSCRALDEEAGLMFRTAAVHDGRPEAAGAPIMNLFSRRKDTAVKRLSCDEVVFSKESRSR